MNPNNFKRRNILNYRKGIFGFLLATAFSLTACQKENSSNSGEESTSRAQHTNSISLKAEFMDMENNKSSLADFQGKKIILHFWATWCKPCIEEFPSLKNALPKLENSHTQILIASDESLEKIEKFQTRFQTGLNLIQLSKGALADFGIYALPTTLILDENGKEIHRIEGKMDWEHIDSIDELLPSAK